MENGSAKNASFELRMPCCILQTLRCTGKKLTGAFSIGKNFNHDSINKLFDKLEKTKCDEILLFFHTFSGCKLQSQFDDEGDDGSLATMVVVHPCH